MGSWHLTPLTRPSHSIRRPLTVYWPQRLRIARRGSVVGHADHGANCRSNCRCICRFFLVIAPATVQTRERVGAPDTSLATHGRRSGDPSHREQAGTRRILGSLAASAPLPYYTGRCREATGRRVMARCVDVCAVLSEARHR